MSDFAISNSSLAPAGSTPASGQPHGGKRPHGGKQPQSRLRLTRRGRVVLIGIPLLLAAAAVLTLSGFFNAPATAADLNNTQQPVAAVEYTVAPGDTLWSVAGKVAPEEDVREVVALMVELNNLDTATIHAGQQLFVPGSV